MALHRSNNEQASPMRPVHAFVLHAIILIVALWVLFCCIFGITTAPTNEMSPNIKSGDLLLYYSLDKSPRAQDVVVYRKNDTTCVGRVVAVSGDTVDITDDESLVINGNVVIEPNVYTSTPRYDGFIQYPLTLAEGQYFILADYRTGSQDSRCYGAVDESELQGTVITAIRRNNL